MMIRVPVTSSNIHSIGYEGGILEVAFKDKRTEAVTGVYDFEGVSSAVHTALMAAASQGAYFAAHIKGKYPFVKVA